MLLQRTALTRRAHALDVLLNSIVFSGLLRSAYDLREATEYALDITIRDDSLRRYFKSLLQDRALAMSKSTIQRHRLTVTFAWCLQGTLTSNLGIRGVQRLANVGLDA